MSDYAKWTKAELIRRVRELEREESRDQGGGKKRNGQDVNGRQARAESEVRLRAILETAAEGIITIDERGIIEAVNPAAERIFGYAKDEIVGRKVNVLMPLPYSAEHDRYITDYLKSGKARIIGIGREVVGKRKDGSLFPMELAVSEVKLRNQRLFAGFIRDVTERSQAEEALRKSEERLDSILANAPAIIYLKDLDGRFLLVNHEFEKLCGISRDQALGKTDFDFFPEEVARQFRSNDARVLAERKPLRFEEYLPRPEGARYYFSIKFPLFDADQAPSAICGISTNVTELRELERQLLEITENEKRRIGQDLHDDLGQQLTGIELMCQVLEQKLAAKSHAESRQAAEIARLVRQTISHTRRLSRGLTPVVLESEGLMAALRELAENTQELAGVNCAFHCPKPVLIEDNTVATHLFRIAQEAVSNAIRHGKAHKLEIGLIRLSNRIQLVIRDHGAGIPERLPKKNGMGLRIMQYRAGMIGGTLVVQKAARGGTTVACTVSSPQTVPPK